MLSLIFLEMAIPAAVAHDDPVPAIIKAKVEQIGSAQGLHEADHTIASVTVLSELYKRKNFQLLWQKSIDIQDLLNEIEAIKKDGLDPDDYHFELLHSLHKRRSNSGASDPDLLVNFDLFLTDGLIRLFYHLTRGKLDPEILHPQWNLTGHINGHHPVDTIEKLIDTGELIQTIRGLKPQGFLYQRLKAGLKEYIGIQTAGGWHHVPEGPILRLGDTDPRVPALRRRLAITGDQEDDTSESEFYDDQLEKAVVRFQYRHRLATDGVVGKNTLAALNVPVAARIDQIRANLERARWVQYKPTGSFLLVDIAGYRAFFYRNNKVLWSSRIQVGNPVRRTPVFRSEIEHLVINPTWTVPSTILHQDIIPAVKNNPDYLKKRSLEIIDNSDNVIDLDRINWSKYANRRFPYKLRQNPGPRNPLGQLKFVFPNSHQVTMHDTPSKWLFMRQDRTFSSGCIRVEQPFELAQILLNNPETWNQESIKTAVDSSKTMLINLPEPVPVLLLYWTAGVGQNGEIHFKRDPYNRDRAVLEGLKTAFEQGKHSL